MPNRNHTIGCVTVVLTPLFFALPAGWCANPPVGAGQAREPKTPQPVCVFDKWGYANEAHRLIIKPQYKQAAPFSEGRARVSQDIVAKVRPNLLTLNTTGYETNERWAYIDTSGRLLFNQQFLEAADFSEGLACVRRAGVNLRGDRLSGRVSTGDYYYINLAGQTVVRIHKPYEGVLGEYHDGLAPVAIRQSGPVEIPGRKFDTPPTISWLEIGFMDRNGAVVIEPQFHAVSSFSEGLAPVQLLGGFSASMATQTLTADGRVYTREVAVYERAGGKWGYLDSQGGFAIKPLFDLAFPFSDGLARVVTVTWNKIPHPFGGPAKYEKVAEHWGFIDKTGKYLIEPVFAGAGDFSEGIAWAVTEKTQKAGFIDRTGKFIIEPDFERADSFSEGLAGVKSQGRWGFVDRAGRLVINFQYDAVKPFMGDLSRVKRGKTWIYIDKQGMPLQFPSPGS